ncbi:F510_1955 family glycosylhydrolase [Cellulomonas sp.]|uniref:F510_1955 family glycosylhydrolase n=1 Tax=Cellulomonas sp. TaxID=40001 RepID=UPI00258DBD4F|nr:exo-alpha-sialidase [Cellulomonas sp.]MCR6688598.1 exo-alpha-sialidase [Cellulomonas sp.]
MTGRSRRVLPGAALVLVAVLVVGACSSAPEPEPEPEPEPAPAAPTQSLTVAGALPGEHVHGVSVDGADGTVHLATHEGLYRHDGAAWTQVGPVIDLMGFTAAEPGHFYASGHPGPGVDLPNPVGLIESTDAGETWQVVSRAGSSDFHALTASPAGVVAFDGSRLEVTTDGTTWAPLDVPVPPYAMDVSPDGRTILVTSRTGPIRSTDAGAGWATLVDVPLLQVVAWADDATVVGVTPEGVVAVSEDAGDTWRDAATVRGPVQAVAAARTADGALRVVLVTQTQALVSDDLDSGLLPLGEA